MILSSSNSSNGGNISTSVVGTLSGSDGAKGNWRAPDTYAFGITLCALLTGALPFAELNFRSPFALMDAVLKVSGWQRSRPVKVCERNRSRAALTPLLVVLRALCRSRLASTCRTGWCATVPAAQHAFSRAAASGPGKRGRRHRSSDGVCGAACAALLGRGANNAPRVW